MRIELLEFHPKISGKSFVGLKYINNTVEIHYPKSFRWTFNDVIESSNKIDVESTDVFTMFSPDILMLLNTINIAKSLSEKEEKAANVLSTKENFSVTSYLWIIKDYLSNGFYHNRETANKINSSGKINWKKTMSQQPIVSKGNIIYPNIVASVKNDSDNIISVIHKYCVKKSIYLVGWLFGLNGLDFGVNYFTDIELSNELKESYNYHLKSELNQTFDDIKRVRLNHMFNVINGLNKSSNGTLVYGVNEYHYIFERMIDAIYGTENTRNYHPKGIWHNKDNTYESSSLEPDTILVKDDSCIIIDAKCYGYFYKGFVKGNYEGLPQTSSIQKQITYGDHIYKLIEDGKIDSIDKDKIYNCFLLPFDNRFDGLMHGTIEYVMYADTNWKDTRFSYDEIFVFFIDMRFVIESWNSQNHKVDIENLLTQIENLFKNKEKNKLGIKA